MTRIVVHDLIDENPRIGKAMLASAPFSQVVDHIVPLLKLRAPSRRTTEWLQDAAAGARAAMQGRNTLLNSHLFVGDAVGTQVHRRKGKSDVPQEVLLEDTEDDPTEMRPGFTTVPNRSAVELPVLPSPSRSKTATQQWVEGKVSYAQLEATGHRSDEDTPD